LYCRLEASLATFNEKMEYQQYLINDTLSMDKARKATLQDRAIAITDRDAAIANAARLQAEKAAVEDTFKTQLATAVGSLATARSQLATLERKKNAEVATLMASLATAHSKEHTAITSHNLATHQLKAADAEVRCSLKPP
jgi:hypothetical protein